MELPPAWDQVRLALLRSKLRVVLSLCVLAHRETGETRTWRLERAKAEFKTSLLLAGRIRPTQQDFLTMEEIRRNLLLLCRGLPELA